MLQSMAIQQSMGLRPAVLLSRGVELNLELQAVQFRNEEGWALEQFQCYQRFQKTSEELVQIIRDNFDLRPGVIVRELNLDQPIYRQTAKNGHFGTNQSFSWEQPKQLKF
ncbi:hypothetical protein NM208_g11347 [Fusarium decemcellulare]|uniref:Uncharacterized protein n=1 Tax=Fusarium decemcellulare TaxID=57161 RepID=A0ACC1RSW7_9HYPO|nr:hypothetical protein NM208_g11347 [Fusarium decemcellulare]